MLAKACACAVVGLEGALIELARLRVAACVID
jgi:hypothetical protein